MDNNKVSSYIKSEIDRAMYWLHDGSVTTATEIIKSLAGDLDQWDNEDGTFTCIGKPLTKYMSKEQIDRS